MRWTPLYKRRASSQVVLELLRARHRNILASPVSIRHSRSPNEDHVSAEMRHWSCTTDGIKDASATPMVQAVAADVVSPPSLPRDRVCVIDLGTNSFHALIVEATENDTFTIIDKLKLPVALGEAGLSTGLLTHDAVKRATRALVQITTLAKRRRAAKVLAYATSAIREAKNGEEFIAHIRDELDLEIEPIDGKREAHLIYLGVRKKLDLSEPTLLVDIGGGSTEFIVSAAANDGEHNPPELEISLPLGAARLTENFISSDPISDEDLERLKEHVRGELAPVVAACERHDVVEIVGSSGTMETLATLAMRGRAGSPEQHVFDAEEMLSIAGELIASNGAERQKMSGLDSRRVDQIVGGAVLLAELIELAGIEQVRISPAALREGMVDEAFGSSAEAPACDDIVMRHARELCVHHGGDLAHANEVARLADALFSELAPIHKMGEKQRRLLRIAALVHDVGHSISGRAHHKHSRYIIEETAWPGFSPRNVSLVSLIARYHRRARPKKKHQRFQRLKKKDRARVRKLGAILRLADQLDRSHIGNTDTVRVGASKRQVHVTISTRLSPEIELEAARMTARAFKDAFGRELVVHAAWQND